MEQEKILSLILSKLDNIEKGQQEMKKEQQEMKKEQQEMKKEQQEMKKEQQEMKNDIFRRLDALEAGQRSIQQYIINTEDLFRKYDEAYEFVERIKKAVNG